MNPLGSRAHVIFMKPLSDFRYSPAKLRGSQFNIWTAIALPGLSGQETKRSELRHFME